MFISNGNINVAYLKIKYEELTIHVIHTKYSLIGKISDSSSGLIKTKKHCSKIYLKPMLNLITFDDSLGSIRYNCKMTYMIRLLF